MAFGNDFFRSGRFWIPLVLLVLVGALVFSCMRWEWIRSGSEIRTESLETGVITTNTITFESVSSTLRNIGLIVGGIVAVLLAMWRSLVAERQASAAQAQASAAQTQADIAQQSLLNERYERGVEMLGSPTLPVRLGGILALRRLAEEHPEQYHVQVMQQLCSFVLHPTEVEGQPTVGSREVELGAAYSATTAQAFAAAGRLEIEVVREDIQMAMHSIASCHALNLKFETQHNYWIDLHGADLRGVDLSNRDLSRAPEYDESAPFDHSMIGTMHTNLRGVKLHYAYLARTNLSQTDLSYASGLIQSILDDACADPRRPPKLDYAFDADTGAPLVWRGNPPTEQG